VLIARINRVQTWASDCDLSDELLEMPRRGWGLSPTEDATDSALRLLVFPSAILDKVSPIIEAWLGGIRLVVAPAPVAAPASAAMTSPTSAAMPIRTLLPSLTTPLLMDLLDLIAVVGVVAKFAVIGTERVPIGSCFLPLRPTLKLLVRFSNQDRNNLALGVL
jgi:hypothetical protein